MPFKQNNRKTPSLAHQLLWCYCFLNLIPGIGFADEFDTLQFKASINNTWDDNVFRQRVNESSDQITTSTAGVKLDKRYSMQRFLVNVNYIDYKYRTNDFLDFETVNHDAEWRWTLTPALTGSLSSSRSKSLAGFSDYRLIAQNIQTIVDNRFRAEYSPFKVWSFILGVTELNIENQSVFNAQSGYDSTALDYGARYTFSSGTNVTLLGHSRRGNFDRALNPGAFFDNGFREQEYELDVVFKASGKSNLSGKVAYLSREYDNFSIRDYDAWVGNIRYELQLTGKIKADANLTRSLSVFETNYSTYGLSDSASLNLSYFITDKLIFGINGRIASRDFDNPVTSGLPKRKDDEKSLGASISWLPTRNIGFTLNSIKSSRDSSSSYNAFDYDDVTTGITIDLKI